MTKRYGSLVGAVKQLVPMQPVDSAFENTKDKVLVRDLITLAAAPAADTIQLGVFGWETMFDPLESALYFDSLGANTTISIGDATAPTALVNAQDTHTAAGSVTPFKPASLANWYQPLWQALGYASLAAARLVGNKCELLLTINTAAATGNLAWQFRGQGRI